MRHPVLLRIAYACWALPLGLATIGLVAYRVSRAGWWAEVGFFVLAIGLVGALLGFACALAYLRLNRGPDKAARWTAWRRARVVLLLLALNFPIAVAYAVVGIWWEKQIYLHVVNPSPDRIDEITVLNREHRSSLGPLPAGRQLTTYFSPRREGPVAIRLTRGSDAREVDITGYASGRRDDSRIVIAEGFRVSVEKLRDR